METQLVTLAAQNTPARQSRWAELVGQLANDRYAKREAADRQLRAGGPAAIHYLEELDTAKLDEEQQSRIRRILRSLPGQRKHADTPEDVADALLDDPGVWLALLDRPVLATRRAAWGRLTLLLGRPVAVDPAADPASQKLARDALRARIDE